MPFQNLDSIRYLTMDILQDAPVVQAVFTRCGGVSTEQWSSLNVGGTVGDDPGHVAENRRLSFQAAGRSIESLFDVWQVHSADVVCTAAPRPPHIPHQKADAILTSEPGVTLFMRFADCVPILLCDPVRKVIGLAHSGWAGTVKRVSASAVQAMHDRYGTQPGDILAAIGPSIGPDHYEVGENVIEQVETAFGQDGQALLPGRRIRDDGSPAAYFDLWSANRLVLEEAGVRKIELASICTACHTEDWYSHRAEAGKTGRFGALISLI
jgi:YfiH family protein